jgi:hypothetical protein
MGFQFVDKRYSNRWKELLLLLSCLQFLILFPLFRMLLNQVLNIVICLKVIEVISLLSWLLLWTSLLFMPKYNAKSTTDGADYSRCRMTGSHWKTVVHSMTAIKGQIFLLLFWWDG